MINFVTTAGDWLASYRYRIQSVQMGLTLAGIECAVSPHFNLAADVCIYGKHLNPCDYPDAIGARALGKKIVFDLCDDHSETKYAEHYKRMIGISDVLTCNSKAMADRVLEVYKRTAVVIPDPIWHEGIDRTPDLSKWLWFGAQWNIQPLLDSFPQIEGKELEICTGPMPPVMRPNTTVTPWSLTEQQAAFRRNGVAFIPYDDNGTAKSANRVIEALNASLVVVTNGIPATKELKPFIESRVEDVGPQSIVKMEAGRRYVRDKFSQKAILKKWKKVLV